MRESEKVIEFIYQEIAAGRMQLGNRLPVERELGLQLGCSRTTVREAMNTLETMGVVESRQGSGNYLTGNISRSFGNAFDMMLLLQEINAKEILQVRKMMELEAFRLAVGRAEEKDLSLLRSLIRGMQDCDSRERAVLDQRFHFQIAKMSGNQLLFDLMEAMTGMFARCVEQHLVNAAKIQLEQLIMVHTAIVDALTAKDESAGEMAICFHYILISNITAGTL